MLYRGLSVIHGNLVDPLKHCRAEEGQAEKDVVVMLLLACSEGNHNACSDETLMCPAYASPTFADE